MQINTRKFVQMTSFITHFPTKILLEEFSGLLFQAVGLVLCQGPLSTEPRNPGWGRSSAEPFWTLSLASLHLPSTRRQCESRQLSCIHVHAKFTSFRGAHPALARFGGEGPEEGRGNGRVEPWRTLTRLVTTSLQTFRSTGFLHATSSSKSHHQSHQTLYLFSNYRPRANTYSFFPIITTTLCIYLAPAFLLTSSRWGADINSWTPGWIKGDFLFLHFEGLKKKKRQESSQDGDRVKDRVIGWLWPWSNGTSYSIQGVDCGRTGKQSENISNGADDV